MKGTLPEDTHLAYTDMREAWFADRSSDPPSVEISASAGRNQGCAWSFSAEEVNLGEHGTALRLVIFDDAFAAFTDIPEFFASLHTLAVQDLDEVTGLLREAGAADETPRKAPYAPEASPADKAAAVLRTALGGTAGYPRYRALAAAILREIGIEEVTTP